MNREYQNINVKNWDDDGDDDEDDVDSNDDDGDGEDDEDDEDDDDGGDDARSTLKDLSRDRFFWSILEYLWPPQTT